MEAGVYDVVLIYVSQAVATFSMAVGAITSIESGAAPSVQAVLPALVRLIQHNNFRV
jgi:hypothetical protein